MTYEEISNVLDNLSIERSLFHLEKDLQFSFAFKVKELYPNKNIRLEWYDGELDENGKRRFIDLLVFEDSNATLIEFKYKTKKGVITVNNETFDLQGQGAVDVGSYLFVKDINRLEAKVNNKLNLLPNVRITNAYAIFLTNDDSYLKSHTGNFKNYYPTQNSTYQSGYIKFNLREKSVDEYKSLNGKTINGEIYLKHSYDIHWKRYSDYLNQLIIQIL